MVMFEGRRTDKVNQPRTSSASMTASFISATSSPLIIVNLRLSYDEIAWGPNDENAGDYCFLGCDSV
jgi:hypothetical protein